MVRTSAERERERVATVSRAIPRDSRLRKLAAGGVLWLIAYAIGVALTADNPSAETLVSNVFYLLPIALATVLSFAAAVRRRGRTRAFWGLLAVSNLGWLGGELIWSFHTLVLDSEPPFPSLADAFYLGSYALVPVAAVFCFGRMGGRRGARALLDASILIVAIATGGYLLLIEPQLVGEPSLMTAVGAAYPLMGVVILIVLVGGAFTTGRRLPVSMKLVTAGFAATAITDVVYTRSVILEGSSLGPWLNLGWQLEAVLLCVAGWIGMQYDEGESDTPRSAARSTFAVVAAGTVATLAIVVLDAQHGGLSTIAMAVAGYAVVALVASLQLTASDHRATARDLEVSLAEQERLAVTDGLTGLHNRRFFEEMVRLESDRATRYGRPLALLVLDLDHFKTVNDTHGHPAGDHVLAQAAERLGSMLRATDIIARYGGEEFAVLLPETDIEEAIAAAERSRQALAIEPIALPHGGSVAVTVSVGVACIPDHATDRDSLIRAADSALYTAKRLGRNQVRVGASTDDNVLQRLVGSSSVLLYLQNLADDIDARLAEDAHSLAMAEWAGTLAERLGLTEEARWRAIGAARLHDIGKVTVPDAILRKVDPLDDREWAVIREHPVHSARLISLDPDLADLAPVVRDHHERPDGKGYPLGKADAEVSIEARIVAVCDAWAAMLAARPYRAPLSRDRARSELRDGVGRQFDARVVEAFLELEAQGRVGSLETTAPAPAPAAS